MNKLSVVLALASLSVAAQPLFADATDTPVTGVFHFVGNTTINEFDPSQVSFVPVGVGNDAGPIVLIGPGIEFGEGDDFAQVRADFTGSTLSVSDVAVNLNNFATGETLAAYELDFSDPAFTSFTQLTGFSDYSYSFSGDTLRVFLSPGEPIPGSYAATFSFNNPDTTGATPEPSSFLLLGTGLAALSACVRRRLVRT